MKLRRRLEALEKRRARQADRLDQLMRDDPGWADPEFRRNVREWDRRLREEEKTMNQVRQAARGLVGLMWEIAGDPERGKAVAGGHGDLNQEWDAAIAALDEDDLRQLQAACHAALGYLHSEQEQAHWTT